ncbi:hypothetical protein DAETH_33150 (plasmid) [Deinococcus aetherius]|uniref:JAB domain-containing protein n=1 Tax=Deinococcus aetherius TaxID=200252 RepID=A0ABM8AHR3_9DEIO|nr:hypothetical protein [Deinococcus aetherius]BDP43346.1 hypothetical protein DAETH_33150 [Deinococcus aetherius]
MTTSFFPTITTWVLPEAAVRTSLAEMARDGRRGNEGVALWLGHRTEGMAEVTHVAVLRGSLVSKAPDLLTIDPKLFAEVGDLAYDLGVRLVGQVHSHGPGSGVRFSRVDHAYGLRVPSYLSAVAPDYALNPHTRTSDFGFHVYEPGAGYRLLNAHEMQARILFPDDREVEVLTVGEGSA